MESGDSLKKAPKSILAKGCDLHFCITSWKYMYLHDHMLPTIK